MTIDHRDHDQREHAKPSPGSGLDFTPDPDTTDTIRAALCRLRYEREQQIGREPGAGLRA